MESLEQIAAEIIAITSKIVAMFGPIKTYVNAIIGVAALFLLTMQTIKIFSLGQSVRENILTYFKPIALFLIIGFYNLIITGLNAVFSPIASATDGMAQTVMKKNEDLKKQFLKDYDAEYENLRKAQVRSEDPNILQEIAYFLRSIKSSIKHFFSLPMFLYLIVFLVGLLIDYGIQAAFLSLLLIRALNLAILIIFGPIAIALSLWTPTKDNWKPWMANYIQKILWLPVAQVTLTAVYTIKNVADKKAFDSMIALTKTTVAILVKQAQGTRESLEQVDLDTSATLSALTTVIISIMIAWAGIQAMKNVPAFANLIVSNATGGQTEGGGSPVGEVIQTGRAAASVVSGGYGLAKDGAKGASKLLKSLKGKGKG